jgi:acyl-[acyl-carrier-protein] desaturase
MTQDDTAFGGHPHIIDGPWTREARQKAVDDAILEAFIEYFGRAMKYRRWSPWHDLPLDEMREYGDRLSEDTINIVEGFLGVEEYIGDYVLAGLEMFRNDRTRRNLQLQWGAEEMKHGVGWELFLIHSRVRTPEQVHDYLKKVTDHRWDPKNHKGLDTPLGVAVYAMAQERATYYNYENVRLRIREEYGLPEKLTPEEKARGKEVGAAEICRVIGVDEVAHHAIFLKMVQINLKYFPEDTLDTIHEVFGNFMMPALRLIPNRKAFIRSIIRTKLQTAETQKDMVENPIFRALGLEDDKAFNVAMQEAKLLPQGLGPEHVSLGKNGKFVIATNPEPIA